MPTAPSTSARSAGRTQTDTRVLDSRTHPATTPGVLTHAHTADAGLGEDTSAGKGCKKVTQKHTGMCRHREATSSTPRQSGGLHGGGVTFRNCSKQTLSWSPDHRAGR